MTKRDFSVDVDDVFNPKPKEEKKEVKPVEEVAPAPVVPQAKKKAVTPKKGRDYIPVGLYLRPEQHKAVKMKALTSKNPEEKDASSIVRLAIDEYLKNHK